MASRYLDSNGLLYLWGKIKNYVTGVVPAASTSNPVMDGTASAGTSTTFARGDHVHPADTGRAAATHSHGNVTSAGALQTNDITIANGDKLVVTDSSDSSKVARASAAFDGSTITKFLSQKGTFETPASGDDNVQSDWNVSDSTSDAYIKNKPTIPSTAADVSAIPTSAKGAASGVCPLNASSKIDTTYLPSYVDDVIEAYPRTGQTELSSTWLSTSSGGSALTPESGKIYVLMADSTSYATNSQFRWSGTAYVKLADGGVSAITNAEIDTIVAS